MNNHATITKHKRLSNTFSGYVPFARCTNPDCGSFYRIQVDDRVIACPFCGVLQHIGDNEGNGNGRKEGGV